LAQNQTPTAVTTVTPPLTQARTVYIVSGHVRYFKTKGFGKTQLVDETPFADPCRKELEKWGRFAEVSNEKDADLIVRVYRKGNAQAVPVMTPGVTEDLTGLGLFARLTANKQ
jgi:hypothetical protein